MPLPSLLVFDHITRPEPMVGGLWNGPQWSHVPSLQVWAGSSNSFLTTEHHASGTMSPQRLVTKRLQLLSWAPLPLLHSLALRKTNCELPYYRSRDWCLWPTASAHLRLANSRGSELGSRAARVEPEDDCTLADASVAALWQTRFESQPHLIPDLQKLLIVNVSCFKPLSFGVIC